MYLIFDTETTGKPLDWGAPASDSANWPRLVQIAWILTDGINVPAAATVRLVKPVEFTIPEDATRIHGITTEFAAANGEPLADVIGHFTAAVAQAQYIIGHNISFDNKIVAAELFRLGVANVLEVKSRICTMMSSTAYCQLPGKRGYKWPTLTELHNKLFGCDFDGSHDAGNDALATMKCFLDLIGRGVISAPLQSTPATKLTKVLRKTDDGTGEFVDIPETDEKFHGDLVFLRALIGQPNVIDLLERPDGLSTLGFTYRLLSV